MIVKLTGKIVYKTPRWVILETGGVGYKIKFKTSSFAEASADRQSSKLKTGEQKSFFIHHHIRENEQSLYGFETLEELELFELLLTVSGVGPKVAMAIMSAAPPEKIKESISKGDATLFKAISGVGGKVSAKIIVELKNKIGAGGEIELGALEESQEVVEALKSLGYKGGEIIRALRELPQELTDISQKVRWCLRFLGRKT